MTFLSPLFLWGLVGALIPLIIHLISLNRTKDMEFSSIRFLIEMRHETIRNLKIKQWLIVLLRTLIIASLVLMIARPSTKGKVFSWFSSDIESKAVIIIDNSASMNLKHDGQSLLEIAKKQGLSLIGKLHEKAQTEIYATNPFELIYSGKQDRMQSIREAFNTVVPSVTYDDLWNKIIQALAVDDQQEMQKECFILTDLQTHPDSTFIHTITNQYTNWKLYFIGQETVKDNMGIYDIESLSQIKHLDRLLKINTVVMNEGDSEKQNVPIEMFLNDERVGQVVTSFEPKRSKEFLFQAFPGTSGVVRGKTVIPADDFELDNEQSFELSIPNLISCLLISRTKEDAYLLDNALQAINGQNNYIKTTQKNMLQIDRLFLENTDVLILNRPDKISSQALVDIQHFAKKGGGIIWFSDIGNADTETSISSSLMLPVQIGVQKAGKGSFFQIQQTEKEHDLFADMTIRNMTNEMPELMQYNKVKLRDKQQSILQTTSGDPYLIQYPFFGGNIFYFSSPVGMEWNDLALKGLFVPLLHRMLLLLATDESNLTSVIAGNEKNIYLPVETINSTWEIHSPSGEKTLLIPDYNQGMLVVKNTDEIGSYSVFANKQYFMSFSTRLHPLERPANRAAGETVVEMIGKKQAEYIPAGDNVHEIIQDIRYGKALWKNFLLLAIILLWVETMLSSPRNQEMKN